MFKSTFTFSLRKYITEDFPLLSNNGKFQHIMKYIHIPVSFGTYFLHFILKPLHTIGKVSVNASILYKNQEICNKTTLSKFQLISLFLLRENSKNAFSIFVFILMAGVFVSRDENSLLDLISLII